MASTALRWNNLREEDLKIAGREEKKDDPLLTPAHGAKIKPDRLKGWYQELTSSALTARTQTYGLAHSGPRTFVLNYLRRNDAPSWRSSSPSEESSPRSKNNRSPISTIELSLTRCSNAKRRSRWPISGDTFTDSL